MGFVKGEKILRCKLAALFRIIDLYGWSQNIYNHVTVSEYYVYRNEFSISFYP